MTQYSKLTTGQKQQIIEYYKTHSWANTAEHFNTSTYIVQRVLREYDIKQRSPEENKRLSCIEKFGTEYAAQSDTVKQHHKETCQNKYGVDNFAKSPLFNERMRSTCRERYGVDNPMQSATCKETFKTRVLAKTGYEWPMQDVTTKDKAKSTCQERYGGQGWASQKIYEKYKNSVKEHYGVDNPMQAQEVKQSLSDNVMSKYGVRWFCLHQKYRLASNHADSKPNKYFAQLLQDNGIEFTREFPIDRYAYDFKIGNILIEVDPSPTHNSTWGVYDCSPLPSNYHLNKSRVAVHKGFRCIHIFDWDDPVKVVNLLKDRQKLFARKSTVKEVNSKEAREFINCYHIQGYARDSIRLGLYYDNELVSIMTFDKPRYNKKFDYELIRYCSSKNVVGGAAKLFKHFLTQFSPKSVVSYCDFSKFTGNVYTELGFKLESTTISKHWYNMKTDEHILDTLLLQRGFDQLLGNKYGKYGKGTNNSDLMRQNGFVEIYDAGQGRYTYFS